MAQASRGNDIYDSNVDKLNLPSFSDNSTAPARKFYRKYFAPGFGRKVIAEVISTYLLVFVTCGAAAISGRDINSISRLGASVAGGLIVTVMIYAVGHISGAHMNPAVTLAFASALRFPWKQVPLYWAAQLTGATVASFALKAVLHPMGITDIGTTTPSGSALQSLVTETVVTFNMMFVTAAVATDTKAVGELAGIAVGSAVCITSIFAGPISGGSMNPGRTIGPALASERYDDLWVYIIGPVCGTQLGAWSYRLIRDAPHAGFSTAGSNSLKLRRLKSTADVAGQTPQKDALEDIC